MDTEVLSLAYLSIVAVVCRVVDSAAVCIELDVRRENAVNTKIEYIFKNFIYLCFGNRMLSVLSIFKVQKVQRKKNENSPRECVL